MIIKNFKIFLLVLVSLQSSSMYYAQQEDFSKKRKRAELQEKPWADAKISERKNFVKNYPALAEGFGLMRSDLQKFMMKNLKGKHSYEKISTEQDCKKTYLDDAIEKAETEIVNNFTHNLQKAFVRITDHEKEEDYSYTWDGDYAFLGNQDLKANEIKIFDYVQKFKDSFTGDVGKKIDEKCPYLLQTAVKQKNISAVARLLDLGVDVNAQSKGMFASTALYTSGNVQADEITLMLLTRKDIDVNIVSGIRTPLYKFAINNNKKIVEKLIALGACRDLDKIYENHFISEKMKKFIKREIAKRNRLQVSK
jgi:hypothetical protein